jgi:NadR type nicotinamide-nucleotide adenylyltransferase
MGKFYPPHNGHLHLIDTARAQSERVTVLLGERPGELIPGALREQWLREMRPDVDIVRVVDETPTDLEHPDYWDIWLDSIRRSTPAEVDAVFSSEAYGNVIGGRLGIADVSVDPARAAVPVSGTAVRGDPYAEWEHLPSPVRAHFARRVALLGPESTGKSTLSRLLARHYETACVAEYGREYTDHCDMGAFGLDDIRKIGQGQVEREDRAAREANRVLICDTELITTAIWSEIYFEGAVPVWVEAESRRRRYDLYLLLDVDIPWVDDGTRTFSHLRQWHFDRIRRELEERRLPYVVISGGFETRFRAATAAVDALLERPWSPAPHPALGEVANLRAAGAADAGERPDVFVLGEHPEALRDLPSSPTAALPD